MINNSGRRKEAIARVYLKEGKGQITVNKKALADYFPIAWHQTAVTAPLEMTENLKNYDVMVNVRGGGVSGQAEAIRLGISKALVEINEEYKSELRNAGFMTRDSRVVERKKSGQKKARKRFQFSKR